MKTDVIYCKSSESMSEIEDESVDLVVTSPPYNIGIKYGNKTAKGSVVESKSIKYQDNLPEDEYQSWQIKILNECYRVLKKDGSMFYNHKIRTKNNCISHPLEWIQKSDFNCRQIITWDRTNSPNQDTCRYVPTTELIFWLCKTSKNPRFKRLSNVLFKTDVWRFAPKKQKGHPAPFPIELPDNIIPSVSQGERITVLDPFMGSGTTAISAIKNGCDYIGFELLEQYVDIANKNIEEMAI
jgi:DNA modification methylase